MKDLKEAFRMFDTNKDGYIDLNELRKVNSLIGTTLTSEDLYKFMNEADKVKKYFWENILHLSLFSPRMEMEKLTMMNLWK